ncbi:FAD-binding domain-containing protein [Penicillium canescens]|nr:FAD-binding domain-containing protein [Penicillium canescens]
MIDLGPVLVNTVTETTAAAYSVGDSASATFFRSRDVDRLQSEVGAILAAKPPSQPLSAAIVIITMAKRCGMGSQMGLGQPLRIDSSMSS